MKFLSLPIVLICLFSGQQAKSKELNPKHLEMRSIIERNVETSKQHADPMFAERSEIIRHNKERMIRENFVERKLSRKDLEEAHALLETGSFALDPRIAFPSDIHRDDREKDDLNKKDVVKEEETAFWQRLLQTHGSTSFSTTSNPTSSPSGKCIDLY